MYLLRSSFASIATGKERRRNELGTNMVRRKYGVDVGLVCYRLVISVL